MCSAAVLLKPVCRAVNAIAPSLSLKGRVYRPVGYCRNRRCTAPVWGAFSGTASQSLPTVPLACSANALRSSSASTLRSFLKRLLSRRDSSATRSSSSKSGSASAFWPPIPSNAAGRAENRLPRLWREAWAEAPRAVPSVLPPPRLQPPTPPRPVSADRTCRMRNATRPSFCALSATRHCSLAFRSSRSRSSPSCRASSSAIF
mmetsp:Transcript_65728/g.183008  ORF Transcript_65728/g.183008 Transcript_65728/m.183008 type:complete len:203 (+) Transcript_65728:23-631(+)